MVFRGYDKLFWDSATKMMLSSLIILISISISIGFPAKTYNIVEEIDHLNCSLTNRFFVEKLRLDTACNLNVADESRYDESTSFGLDLCMAYLELNKDYCKINTNSTHYRSSLFDENTHFIIHDISQYNSTQVDDFLQELNKRVKDVNSFCKHLSDSKTQFEQYRWSKKFFRQISSEGSCELLCGESNSNVKDICSVWLWARTLKVEQAVSETNKNNNSFIDSKQHTFTEVLNPPSRNAAKKDAALSEAPNHVAPSGPSSKLTPPPSLESHPAASNVPTLVTSFSQNGNNAADVAQKLPSSTSSGNNANRIETVDDNRYENVEKGDAEEGRADELKSSVDVGEKDAKKADDGGGREQPAEFEDNEPQVAPAKGEVQEQPQSNVMSIKDHNEEAAAAAGQFDSNFNERQPLLTVQDDKQPPVEPNNNDENAANNNNANNDEFEDGPADEDGDDVNPLDIGAQEPPAKQADVSGGAEQMSVVARGNMDPIGSDESHFYSYFVSMGAILVLLYLMLHYKKKLVALAVEGRRGRGHSSGRRRPNTAAYSKLDSNLEEAMASNMSQASVTHVLY